ncbi:MAG: hypothetical protein ACPGJS_07800 [Flammeovirgaceae bacterium]
MGKKVKDTEKVEDDGKAHIEVDLDSEEKADALAAFMKSYKCISNEELRKRLKTDEDDEESAPPFE